MRYQLLGITPTAYDSQVLSSANKCLFEVTHQVEEDWSSVCGIWIMWLKQMNHSNLEAESFVRKYFGSINPLVGGHQDCFVNTKVFFAVSNMFAVYLLMLLSCVLTNLDPNLLFHQWVAYGIWATVPEFRFFLGSLVKTIFIFGLFASAPVILLWSPWPERQYYGSKSIKLGSQHSKKRSPNAGLSFLFLGSPTHPAL